MCSNTVENNCSYQLLSVKITVCTGRSLSWFAKGNINHYPRTSPLRFIRKDTLLNSQSNIYKKWSQNS